MLPEVARTRPSTGGQWETRGHGPHGPPGHLPPRSGQTLPCSAARVRSVRAGLAGDWGWAASVTDVTVPSADAGPLQSRKGRAAVPRPLHTVAFPVCALVGSLPLLVTSSNLSRLHIQPPWGARPVNVGTPVRPRGLPAVLSSTQLLAAPAAVGHLGQGSCCVARGTTTSPAAAGPLALGAASVYPHAPCAEG